MRKHSSPTSPLLLTAIQLGLLMLVIYYTFIGGQTAQGIYDHQWRLATLWLTSLIIIGWLLWQLWPGHQMPRTPFDVPLLFLLLAWIAATFFSVNPVYSQETLVFFVIYLFFFYIAADVGRRPWFAELWLNAIIAVSGLVWTLALWQLSNWYQSQGEVPLLLQDHYSLLASLPRLSVLGNPNTMAGFITLIAPLVLHKIVIARRLLTRLLLVLWMVMLLGAILLTQSRGGMLGLIIALAFWITIVILRKQQTSLANLFASRRISRRVLWPIIVTIVGLSGLFIWLALNFRNLTGAIAIRQQVMSGAIKTLWHHPILGAGPGALGEELIRHQKPLDTIWADAHNLFLTIVAETGLVGAIGLLWVVGVGLKVLWSALRQRDVNRWDMLSMACVAALLGFAAHNLVDSLFKFPLIMLLVATLAGLWLSPYLPAPSEKQTAAGSVWGYPVIALALLAASANMVIGINSARNIEAYNHAVEAASRQDWPTTLNYLEIANQSTMNFPFYQRQLGLASGYLSAQNPAYRAKAIESYRDALSRVDQLAIDHANLSCLLWAEGRRVEARQAMALAQELEPDNPLYALNLGFYLEMEGAAEAARREYARILTIQPNQVKSSYWQQTAERANALPEIIRYAIQDLSEVSPSNLTKQIQLYLGTNNTEAARTVYQRLLNEPLDPAIAHLWQGKILWAMAKLPDAKAEFEQAIQLDPRTDQAYLYLSKIALAQNNVAEARQYIEAARFLEQDAEILYYSALIVDVIGQREQAVEQYEQAFSLLVTNLDPNLSRYATEVARRRPMPVSYLPCLIRIYPTELMIAITRAEGDLFEKQGDFIRAGQVYRRLLTYEPTATSIVEKLALLCQNHANACQS